MALPGVIGTLRTAKARLHVEVTNLNDSGAGSLRAAIAAANAAPDLAAVITFQSGLTGTLTLGGTQLNIYESMNIVGPGSDVITIDGDASSRCLYMFNSSGRKIDVNVSGLTLQNGRGQLGGNLINFGADLKLHDVKLLDGNTFDVGSAGGGGAYLYGGPHGSRVFMELCVISGNNSVSNGGGIAKAGTSVVDLTLERCDVLANTAAGAGGGISMLYDGTLEVAAASIVANNGAAGNGGGVYAGSGATDRTVTVEDSTVENNQSTAGQGGGVFVQDQELVLRRATVRGNTANSIGGGVDANNCDTTIDACTISGNTATGGGGVYLYDGTAQVTNSTISGNHATAAQAGGLFAGNANLTLSLSTIANNDAATGGGGMKLYGASGTSTARNCVIAGNAAPADADVLTAATSLNADYTLIEDPGTATIVGAHNITGQDPQLGALADNGGPTETMLPAPSSPVIDAGDPAFTPPPATDQRGFPRVVGGGLDMGAVERQ